MPPQLAEILLRTYFTPGDLVLDPFCGSGTTLVAAAELGIDSIGYDVAAFNVLLSRVKTEPPYSHTFLAQAGILAGHTLAALHEPTEQTYSPYVASWYTDDAAAELVGLAAALAREHWPFTKDALTVLACRAARSARCVPHFALDRTENPVTAPYWCYKHQRTCYPPNHVLPFVRRYALDMARRFREWTCLAPTGSTTVLHGDSLTLGVPPVSGVLTSPPYLGLLDYHRQHEYAYRVFGLPWHEDGEIGPRTLGTASTAREVYTADVTTVLRRALAAMPSGGPLVIVAGDRHGLYPGIARDLGVEVEAVHQRQVDRRTGLRKGGFTESVFVWRKRS